jgi:uncharacterized protein (DUF433 family)
MRVDYDAIQEDPALRRGLYGLVELTRYLRLDHDGSLSASTVSRWAHREREGTLAKHTPRRPDYSFGDLISMLVVRDLVHLGLRLSDVIYAERHLRETYGHVQPFVSLRLKTDGVDVFYDAAPAIADQLTAANRGGQEVLEPAIEHALKGVSYERGMAAAWAPTAGVLLDPAIQFGEPCVASTRVTTGQLAELARSSEITPLELARTYRLEESQVQAALVFEQRLATAA